MMMPSNSRWPAQLAVSVTTGCLLWISGCSSDPEQTTLFDHSHETPDHWPHSLGDMSVQIRERLEKLDADDESAAAELVDLVSWTPEFAADTSMAEQEWDPIYEASESLRLRLEDSEGVWDSENRQKAQSLCVLIDAAWSQLPEEERQAGRFQIHDHDHDHHDDHGDHHGDHGDHHDDHGDHHEEHGDHEDEHGDHDREHANEVSDDPEDGHDHDHDDGHPQKQQNEQGET